MAARGRAGLFVRCSAKEAALIKEAAKKEHRTISGYIVRSVLARIANQKKLQEEWKKRGLKGPPPENLID